MFYIDLKLFETFWMRNFENFLVHAWYIYEIFIGYLKFQLIYIFAKRYYYSTSV